MQLYIHYHELKPLFLGHSEDSPVKNFHSMRLLHHHLSCSEDLRMRDCDHHFPQVHEFVRHLLLKTACASDDCFHHRRRFLLPARRRISPLSSSQGKLDTCTYSNYVNTRFLSHVSFHNFFASSRFQLVFNHTTTTIPSPPIFDINGAGFHVKKQACKH